MSNVKSERSFFAAASPLFLVLFLDGMGLGLVFPILNALLIDPSVQFFQSRWLSQNAIFGLTIGIFMFCWFLGAAFLGDLSDQIGRKKSLLICLLGSSLGYLLSAIAVVMQSFSLLLLGRVIAGLTSGSQPIAQAAIIDLSTPEHKARNIGFILLSLSFGFIFGPLLGGVLSDPDIVSWFNFTTPFYFTTVISLLNAVLLWWLFNESFKPANNKVNLKLFHAIEIFISAFRHEKIRHLSIIFLVFILGWSSFYSFISMFLLKVYGFNILKVSIFMAVMGLGFGIGFGFVVNYTTNRFSLKNNVMVSLILSAFLTLIIALTSNPLVAWLLVAPLGCLVSIGYSASVTMFSNQVDANSQGWIMGITGSIMAIVFAIDAVVLGLIAERNIHLPIIIGALGLGVSGAMMYFFRGTKQSENNVENSLRVH